MTNEELLQNAKDQVAQETWDDGLNRFFNDWDDFINNNPWSTHRQFHLLNKAALLAIQSAREEAVKQFRRELTDHFGKLQEQAPTFKDATYLAGVRTVIDCHGKTDAQILNELNPKDEKLTDPGR